jgi:hypothetical protein
MLMKALGCMRANAVAWLALFVALGGTGYAAMTLPAGSVGTSQLRNGAVTPAKLGRGLGGYVRDWARVSATGRVEASNRRARQINVASDLHGYVVRWDGDAFPGTCVPMVTTQITTNTPPPPATYAEAQIATNPGPPRGATDVVVFTFNGQGRPTEAPFYVVVTC